MLALCTQLAHAQCKVAVSVELGQTPGQSVPGQMKRLFVARDRGHRDGPHLALESQCGQHEAGALTGRPQGVP